MAERKAVIKNADMSEVPGIQSHVARMVLQDMQQDSIDCAAQAMEKFNIEKDIAACE